MDARIGERNASFAGNCSVLELSIMCDEMIGLLSQQLIRARSVPRPGPLPAIVIYICVSISDAFVKQIISSRRRSELAEDVAETTTPTLR
jgi:hypothetical protein